MCSRGGMASIPATWLDRAGYKVGAASNLENGPTSTIAHFATRSAADGSLFLATGTTVEAYAVAVSARLTSGLTVASPSGRVVSRWP
jgi:hypothetical protein